jgi:hypothetical protein
MLGKKDRGYRQLINQFLGVTALTVIGLIMLHHCMPSYVDRYVDCLITREKSCKLQYR